MGLINTDDLVLIGPGSEWFWSMLQFVIVAVTLVGIYYQLRISRSANAFAQLGALVDEWQGELLVRKRIGVLVAIRDGAAHADVPDSPAAAIANFWEKVGALVRAGHIDQSLVCRGLRWGPGLVGDPCPVGAEGPDRGRESELLGAFRVARRNDGAAPPGGGLRSAVVRPEARGTHHRQRGRSPRPRVDAPVMVAFRPRLRCQRVNSFQCPSETTSTVPSTTWMAV